MEKATLERVYHEIKLLRKDVDHLKQILVPEVEPEPDEIRAVRIGRREFRAKQYVEWSKVKKQI
ncbi:MAG: hypothetical protein HYU39_00215 [Thaumarchaeota archaeon]|nr:hypothetical protein [Nitrososphaerota archaeon]